MGVTMLDMSCIVADPQAQPRVAMQTEVVEGYKADMADGAEFPPIVVFGRDGRYWIGDGFHRYFAAQGLGLAEIAADVRDGDIRDAILFSCSANAAHGLRRTNEDKRRAVMRLLDDPEWADWSDREIARRCGVNHEMVGRLRPSLAVSASEPAARTYITKHGTPAVMNTANIGKSLPSLVQLCAERDAERHTQEEDDGTELRRQWLRDKAREEEADFDRKRWFREIRKLWNAAPSSVAQQMFRDYIAKE